MTSPKAAAIPMPKTMRAVRLDEVGPAENLRVVEKAVPEPGPDEVLIKVELAGPSSVTSRRAGARTSPKPARPGSRPGSGRLHRRGGDQRARIHRRRARGGAGALARLLRGVRARLHQAADPAGRLRGAAGRIIRLPDNVSFAQALVYLVNFRLAHLLFHGSSQVPRGTTIVVQGAAGGMGSMITQLAHAHGCPVIATCRRAEEESYLLALGATHVVNVTHTDYVTRVRELTAGEGVRFVFNGVGGDTLRGGCRRHRAVRGDPGLRLRRGQEALDLFRVKHSIALKTFSADDFFATPMFPAATAAMHEWFRSGPLLEASVILPLAQVAEANRLLERGEVLGKIALRP